MATTAVCFEAPLSPSYRQLLLWAMACQTSFVMANTLLTHFNRWIEFLGGDVKMAGWIMGTGPVLGLLARPWVGQWINRWGATRVWLVGYAVFAAGIGGNLVYPTLTALFAYRAALVLGSALVFTSSLTYITLAAPPDRRTEAIGLLGAGGFIGMIAGPSLGDWILGPPPRSADDFYRLFMTALVILTIATLGMRFLQTPMHETRVSAPARLSDFVRTSRQYWPGSILVTNLVFGLCMAVPFVFLASYVDAYKIRVGSLPAISIFFWGYAGWGLFVRITSARVADRWCRRRVLIWGLVLMGLGMLSYLWVPTGDSWRLLIPALVCGTAHAVVFHTMVSLSIEPFADEVRGTGSALSLMTQDLGMIGGAPILGQIAAAWGFNALFVTVAIACLAAAAVYGWSTFLFESQSRTAG
ncbi:MAG: MFS transporter [Pirellulales bacterium]